MKFEFRNILLAIVLSLVLITILSMLISQYSDFETIKTGKAFLLIFVSVFLAVVFWAGYDKKLVKSEIWTLVLVAIILTVSFVAIFKFIPEIFSAFPTPTKELFSVFIK